MIKKYFTAIVFASICYVSSAQIQNPTLSNLSLDKRTGLPRYAEFSAPSGFTEVAFLDWFMTKYQFKPGVTFEILRTDVDDIGFTHSRYKQYYKGIEVLHSMLILHSKNGFVESFNGDYFNNFSDNDFGISADMARTIALNSYGSAVVGKWEIAAEEKFIQQLKNDSNATWFPKIATEYYAYPEYYDGKLPLVPCFSFDIALSEPHVYQQVLVNAISKKVYRTIPLEVHTDSAGKAVTVYEGTKNIVADFVTSNSFRLRETGKRKVETYNSNIGTDYTDGDNFWNNGTDKIAGDIHYGAELVSDFLKASFNTNSYDNKGGALVSVSSGGSGNAFWNLGSNYATFLIGSSGSVGPCAALDVVGHEFGHGIADEIAGLVYSGEACALHESFADINGHNTEWQNDSLKTNWYIGEKVWSSSNGIRYMRDPFVFSNPKAYGGQYFPQGCHGSGGVQNYWFYIQVAGDTATNEFSYSYKLAGLGHKKANAILYRSMFYYMVPNGLFSDQYIGTLKAAKDLYGSCSDELEHTYKAWKAVNVEDTSVKTVDLSHGIKAPTLICNGAPVTSTLNSFGDVSRKTFWQIGNTDTTSKRSFAYSFNNTGKYHIKLTTTTCGKSFVDSMYIMINHSPKPQFKVPFDTACASKSLVTINNNTVNADKKIPLKYSWYVNPGAFSDTNRHLKTSFPDAMDYEIQLKAYYEGGCWSVAKKLVTLLEAPKPIFTVVRDVCENRSILVRNNTDTANKKLDFEWIFPDNTIFKGFEPKTKSLNTYGNYKIILKGIFPFGGCSDTVQRNIKILPNPKPDFTFKNNCQGLQMSVYGAGSSVAPKQWNQWHLGTFNPINRDSLAFAALDSVSRTIGYTLGDSAGCFATTYKTVILEKLSVQMQVDKVCFGESSKFNPTIQNSESYTQHWTMGDGKTYSSSILSHTYAAPGKYNVDLDLTSKSCKTRLTTPVLVMATPNIDFTTNNVCDGDTVYFKNETKGKDSTQFIWNFGNNKTSNTADASHLYSNGITRTFNVNLTGKFNSGCESSNAKPVTVYELPKCDFNANYDATAGNNGFNFNPAVGGYTSYSWDFGDGNKSSSEKPFHRYTTNGDYTVTLIAKNSVGCDCELVKTVSANYSGIVGMKLNEIIVYPNPAIGQFIIENSAGSFDFKLFDTKGSEVFCGSGEHTTMVNTEGLESGIYQLQVIDKKQIKTVIMVLK